VTAPLKGDEWLEVGNAGKFHLLYIPAGADDERDCDDLHLHFAVYAKSESSTCYFARL
jgi:hypothetical protein